MDTLAKIAFAIVGLGVLLAFVFAILPFEFASFTLTTWSTMLSGIVSFLNATLGQLSSFIDIALLLVVLKVVLSLYLVGFSIKLFQLILGFFTGK